MRERERYIAGERERERERKESEERERASAATGRDNRIFKFLSVLCDPYIILSPRWGRVQCCNLGYKKTTRAKSSGAFNKKGETTVPEEGNGRESGKEEVSIGET